MKIKILFFYILININFLYAENIVKDPSSIFKNLRCLVCQGQSVADSNSDFARTLKLVVQDKIDEGKTEKEIYDFLIDKYGEWIVYKPRFNLKNSTLWLFPYLTFIIGGFMIFLFLKKRRNR